MVQPLEDVRTKVRVHGSRPSHTHKCPQGEHRWQCNSPYCNDLDLLCPEHGGPEPIVMGYEPWKGR